MCHTYNTKNFKYLGLKGEHGFSFFVTECAVKRKSLFHGKGLYPIDHLGPLNCHGEEDPIFALRNTYVRGTDFIRYTVKVYTESYAGEDVVEWRG